jgi:tripartite-type tricarboxylate transporter receptor subunit TctC
MHRRSLLKAAFSAALAPSVARAQAWPAKPIRFIVPYIPGSAPDVIARTLAERLSPALGQSLVIENRAGAGGNIGTELAAKAAPDGYNIALATSAIVTNPWLYRKVGYDPVNDFTAIHFSISMPHLLVVAADAPVRTVADLLAMLKDSPGKFNYASGGNGSGAHLATELFKSMAGVDMVHVPFKGAPEIITSVISKTTLCGCPTLATAVPQVKGGRLRAIAVTGAKRNHALPEVPTIGETVAGYEFASWFGLVAPAKTPMEVVRRIDAEAQKALQDPAFRSKVQADGTEVVNLGHAEFAAHIKADYAKFKRVVELSGARVD